MIVPTILEPQQHGYVAKRSVVTAWLQILKHIHNKPYIAEYDLSSFFDGLDHNAIWAMLVEKLHVPLGDKSRWFGLLTIPVKFEGKITKTTKGIAQGIGIAPLLCVLTLQH
jgi:hypothetical protein